MAFSRTTWNLSSRPGTGNPLCMVIGCVYRWWPNSTDSVGAPLSLSRFKMATAIIDHGSLMASIDCGKWWITTSQPWPKWTINAVTAMIILNVYPSRLPVDVWSNIHSAWQAVGTMHAQYMATCAHIMHRNKHESYMHVHMGLSRIKHHTHMIITSYNYLVMT